MSILKERLQQRAAERVAQERATQPIARILPIIDPPASTATLSHYTTPTPEPERIHPVARRLSDLLYDPALPEIERFRLEQIVLLVLADRRPS